MPVISILRYCFAYAWRGSFPLSNGWATVLGGPLLYLLALVWRGKDVGLPEGLWGFLELAFACLGAAWLVIFVAKFFYAPVVLIQEQNQSITSKVSEMLALRMQLERETDRNRPSLKGSIEQVITARNGTYPVESIIFLNINIINTGFPSAVDKWEIDVVDENQTNRPAKMYLIGQDTTVQISGGTALVLNQSDSIYQKAAHPVQTGSFVRGWAMIGIDTMPHFEVIKSTFEVRAKDMWGNSIHFTIHPAIQTSDISLNPTGSHIQYRNTL